MSLRAVVSSSLALRARRESATIRFGFEPGEAWGSFNNTQISTARVRSGSQSMYFNGTLTGSAVLGGLDVGPVDGRWLSMWVYLESQAGGAGITKLTATFSAIGRVVDFKADLGVAAGIALNTWTEITAPMQSSLGPLSNLTSLRLSLNAVGSTLPVFYLDDIGVRSSVGVRARRTSSLALRARRTS